MAAHRRRAGGDRGAERPRGPLGDRASAVRQFTRSLSISPARLGPAVCGRNGRPRRVESRWVWASANAGSSTPPRPSATGTPAGASPVAMRPSRITTSTGAPPGSRGHGRTSRRSRSVTTQSFRPGASRTRRLRPESRRLGDAVGRQRLRRGGWDDGAMGTSGVRYTAALDGLRERQVRRGAFSIRRRTIRVAVPVLAAALLGGIVASTVGAVPVGLRPISASRIAASHPPPPPRPKAVGSEPVAAAAAARPMRIMLVGDSMSASVAPGLQREPTRAPLPILECRRSRLRIGQRRGGTLGRRIVASDRPALHSVVARTVAPADRAIPARRRRDARGRARHL